MADISSSIVCGHFARHLSAVEWEKLQKDNQLVNEFKQKKLEEQARKNWDLFYKRNEGRFFKDRHWTTREFQELDSSNFQQALGHRPVLLEVGCGVGNFVFPLIEEKTPCYIYACDFSPRAVCLLKENPLYNEDVCHAFVCDVTMDDLTSFLHPDSVDLVTVIFVLSAIHPNKMLKVLENVRKVLRPGGLILLRDYGLYDQAMLRFSPGHKLDENFYVRQDGTRSYYFSVEYVSHLFEKAGFITVSSSYVTRQTVNKKESLCVPRVFVQGKFRKPESGGSSPVMSLHNTCDPPS